MSLFSLTGYAQFSLAPNGVTIVCPGANSGDTGVVDGVTYTAVDYNLLNSKLNAGEDLSLCCTTPVTSLNRLFENKYSFNGDISNWDTSNVTDMERTFNQAYNFNQDISNWDTSNVTTMNVMFGNARAFNADIGGWDTSNVTTMGSMFSGALAFNGDIGDWDVSNVTNMAFMFLQTDYFNQDIGDWDLSSATQMHAMFFDADAFNQDIGDWDVSNVKIMESMFARTAEFNQDLSDWDVNNVTNFIGMFAGASVTGGDVNFNNGGNPLTWECCESATELNYMFYTNKVFNQAIGSWDISNVKTLNSMFSDAEKFNQDISCWDTSSATNMRNMFYSSYFSGVYTDFNQDISNWCVDNISSEPPGFTTTATLSDSNKPVWGSCPTTDRLVLTTNDSDNVILNYNYGILEITASFTQSVTTPKISIGNLVTAQDMNVVSPTNATYSWDVPNSVSPGTYTISIDNYSGCKNSLAITIIAPQTPPASSDPSQTVAEVSNDFYGEPIYGGNGLNLFANRLAVSDNGSIIAAASAHSNDGLGTNMNYVKVMDQSGSQIGQILSYSEDGVDLTCTTSYGLGLAISGDGQRLFIGAPYHNTNRGRVRMYEYNSGSNTWDVTATLTATLANMFYGYQIETNQDGTLLFNSETNIKTVRVYSIPKGSTTFTNLVGQSMQARGEKFTVSRDGTALIGLINNTDYLSVYKYSGGTWNTITTATSLKNESGGNAGFGKGMDISDGGNRVVFLDNSTNPRSIHIYEYGGGTTWTKMASFQENAPDVRDKGSSADNGGNVSISRDGNRVMVAAPGSQKPGDQFPERGAFLIYEWDGTSWSKTDLVYGKVMSQYEGSVAKMSGDGSTFVTGALKTNPMGGYKKGVVRVYRKTDDNDGDGYTNEYEALCGSDPNDASSRPADNDGDGSPDCFDTDDDNDGVTDTQDCDPIDPLETLDTDSDGICNNDDTDDDNDGTIDTEDDLPLDPTETVDTDSDGTGDNADADDDGDGFLDVYEIECLSDPLDSLSFPDDIDGDFIPDCQDNDNDNDGVTDDIETQCGNDPLDSSSTPLDTDLDGTLDCFDLDDDNDSYNDNDDDFPLDATEWLDTDGDGVGNNADEDDDNDGYWDYEDFFQFDPLEWFDFDNDGTGDNADTDDDNDGYPDSFDAFPFNPFEWVDTDGDGVGNNDDTDNDDDGIPDSEEENIDTDGDGLNNDVDNDDDGDGIPTLAEDANGNGDPTDDDEDGDGIYDALESLIRDFDSDGVVDQLDNNNTDPYNDSDGDGYSNQDETRAGTNPLDNTEYPEDFESEELNFKITNFFSPNGDGVDDQWKIKEVERYPKSQIWIFLRTGKEIFYASPYRNNWDGNFKGNSLPSGSYYYRLDLDGNGKIDFEGWLYLQR